MKGKGRSNRKDSRKSNSKNVRRDREIIDTSKREMRTDERECRDCRSTPNDPAWYAHNKQVVVDFASLPFGNPLGSKLPADVTTPFGFGSISGIMTLYYGPTLGVVDDENNAVNVAMRNIYSYVRHANSGHANYDAPDLMLYLLAMDSVYMYHAWLKRLYGQLMLATTYNRYYPKALIESEGVDYDDLQSHISDFRGYINMFATRIGSMAVPNSMSYMARHTWMTTGLYVDDPSTPKAQTYKYVPAYYLQFYLQEESNNYVGALQYATPIMNSFGIIKTGNNKATFQNLVTFGDSLLAPILANEDMNIMSGDVLKAFGNSGIVQVMGITENYMILPEYSAEVLSQIENASVYYGPLEGGVTQTTGVGTGYLVSKPKVQIKSDYSFGNGWTTGVVYNLNENQIAKFITPVSGTRLFNMHHQDVTPDQVMVASRLLNNVTAKGAKGMVYNGSVSVTLPVTTCGSDIICSASIWQFSYNAGSGGNQLMLVNNPFSTLMPILVNQPSTLIESVVLAMRQRDAYLAQVTQFDWHPFVYPCYLSTATGGAVSEIYAPNCLLADVSNYTTISEGNLSNMNDIALLSEFSVPQIATGN